MTKEALIEMLYNYTDDNGVLLGVDDLARLLKSELEKAETRGYFRAMKDIQSGVVEQINSL